MNFTERASGGEVVWDVRGQSPIQDRITYLSHTMAWHFSTGQSSPWSSLGHCDPFIPRRTSL